MSDIKQSYTADHLNEAFGVLVKAVTEQAADGRAPTASQVRLGMKRLTYDGFDPARLGYKRFRDFLQAAADANRIVIEDRPGDVVVSVAGEAPSRTAHQHVRGDLWKAALDWSSKVHYYDIEQDRILTMPATPVPLEPERFGHLRQRVAAGDEALVAIPSIDIHTQVSWMEKFAASLDDPSVQGLLLGALGGDKPAKLFAAVLRNEIAVRDRWYRSLTANVLAHLQGWKEGDRRLEDLRLEVERRSLSASPRPETAKPAASAASSRALVEAASNIVMRTLNSSAHGSFGYWRSTARPESHLRELLHQAIERMPEDELRSIRIPVGYLLED